MKSFKALVIGAILFTGLGGHANPHSFTTCEIDEPYWRVIAQFYREDEKFYAKILEISGEEAEHAQDVIRLENVASSEEQMLRLVQVGSPIRHPVLGGSRSGRSNGVIFSVPESGTGTGTFRAQASPMGSEVGSDGEVEELICHLE